MVYRNVFAATLTGILFFGSGCATNDEAPEAKSSGHDAELASKLGADEYGMRRYVLAFLKAGPNRSQSEAEANELQRAHMANIKRMADEGKLAVAGPFLDGGELRGLYLFAVESIEEARKLTETDPAVKAGRLILELHAWYGSAALMQVSATHRRIAKVSP